MDDEDIGYVKGINSASFEKKFSCKLNITPKRILQAKNKISDLESPDVLLILHERTTRQKAMTK